MKELTIQTAVIKDPLGGTMNPYWFTREMTIHVTSDKKATVDIDTLSNETLIEIYNGVTLGLIDVDGEIEYLNEKILTAIFGEKTPAVVTVPADRAPISIDEQKILKVKVAIETAEKETLEVLSKPQPEIKAFLGLGKLSEDGRIEKGCDDLLLLNTMLTVETKTKKRKPITTLIKERIALIEQYGIKVNADIEELKIEDVEEKRLKYNEETKSFDELPLENTEEKL